MVTAIFIRYQSPLEEELCLKILKNIQILKLKYFGFLLNYFTIIISMSIRRVLFKEIF